MVNHLHHLHPFRHQLHPLKFKSSPLKSDDWKTIYTFLLTNSVASLIGDKLFNVGSFFASSPSISGSHHRSNLGRFGESLASQEATLAQGASRTILPFFLGTGFKTTPSQKRQKSGLVLEGCASFWVWKIDFQG